AMATPPIVGVGALCHRSGLGGTTAPTAGAPRRTSAHSDTDASSEISRASGKEITITRGIAAYGRAPGDGRHAALRIRPAGAVPACRAAQTELSTGCLRRWC